MEDHNNRTAQYWITLAVSLASLTASASLSWNAPVLPKFHNNETDIHLTDEEISWLVSSTAPGMMTGCLSAQFPAQKFGRRATVLASAFPFFIGTTFILNATRAWMLCVGRFCWGFSCGMIQTVVMIYIVEIAAKDIRGKLTVGNRFVFSIGGFFVMAVGSMTSYQTLSYTLIVLPACYFIACLMIPETPYFLLKEAKVEAAGKVLMKLNGYGDKKVLEDTLKEMRSTVEHDMHRSGSLKELLTGRSYRKAVLISVGLGVSRLMTGSVPMKQYVGRILQETTVDISVTTGLISFGAVRFISSMAASLLVDNVGRRPLLIFSFTGTSVTLAVLGSCFFMDEVMNITPSYFGYINLVCNLLLCIISTLGYDTIGFIIPAELFPLNVKTTAMTYLNLLNYIINFISLRGYQIVKNFYGLYGVFWFFGFASFVGAVFTYVAIPETKGKSLREIQQELQGDLFIDTNIPAINKKETNIQELENIGDADELKALKAGV